jgi:hypothetical protein
MWSLRRVHRSSFGVGSGSAERGDQKRRNRQPIQGAVIQSAIPTTTATA